MAREEGEGRMGSRGKSKRKAAYAVPPTPYLSLSGLAFFALSLYLFRDQDRKLNVVLLM